MKHNKVYVRIAEDDNFGTASIEPRPFTEAYIHKDVLLEWAKNVKRVCKGAKPLEKAYQTVIDKIESL